MADPEVVCPPRDVSAQFDDDVFCARATVATGNFPHFLLIPFDGLSRPFHFTLLADFEPEELALGERRALALGAVYY